MGVLLSFFNVTQDPGRISGDDRVGWDIFGDHAARADNRVFTDGGIAQNRDAGANGRAPANDGALDFPVSLGLQLPAGGCSPRIAVVNKGHTMTDEDVIFDHDSFTDKAVTGYLAALPDCGVLLNLDERADFRLVAYFTSVKVDELSQSDIGAQLDVGRNAVVRVHR